MTEHETSAIVCIGGIVVELVARSISPARGTVAI